MKKKLLIIALLTSLFKATQSQNTIAFKEQIKNTFEYIENNWQAPHIFQCIGYTLSIDAITIFFSSFILESLKKTHESTDSSFIKALASAGSYTISICSFLSLFCGNTLIAASIVDNSLWKNHLYPLFRYLTRNQNNLQLQA